MNSVGHSPAGSMAQECGGSTTVLLRSAQVGVRAEDTESAKNELWTAVRNAVNAKSDLTVPESFKNLSEEGKQKVAQLTVDWVFSPVNDETVAWFKAFANDTYIQQYVENTVSQATYKEVTGLGTLKFVGEKIIEYGMLKPAAGDVSPSPQEMDGPAAVENAMREMKMAIRKGVANHHRIVLPESFMKLSERAKQEVTMLTATWVFDPVDEGTHRRFECFVSDICIRPYLKNTLPQETYDVVVRVSSNYVKEKIEKYGMLESDEDAGKRVLIAQDELWDAVLIGVANRRDATTPKSFSLLSARQKQTVVQHVVGQLTSVNWWVFEDHFNRITANEDVKPYLKGTLTQDENAMIQKKLSRCSDDAKKSVADCITAYQMVAED
ncbi:hypothetical protein [Pandoraea sputorum]|nr:hypothetical protein [Pandoraea sputorum]